MSEPRTPEEKFEDILNVFGREISFYQESTPPLRYRVLCWIRRIRPRHEVVVQELESIQREILGIWLRDGQ